MKKSIIFSGMVYLMVMLGSCSSGNKKTTDEGSFQVKLEDNKSAQRIDVTVNGQPFTSYVYSDTLKKPILFPVIAADGITVTRGYPLAPRPGERVDHPHQTGFWFNYGNVNGLDFWGNGSWVPDTSRYRFGTIRLKSIDSIQNDKGVLNVTHEWVDDVKKEVLILEKTSFAFSAGKDYRVIDRTTTFTAMKPEVTFYDTKEGAIAIRVARFLEFPSNEPRVFIDSEGHETKVPVMNDQGVNGNYRSSEGIEGVKVWGTRAKWMKLYAVNGSDTVSLVMMDHPSNPNFPTYWHARDYGLFSANPFGAKDFTEGKEVLNMKLKQGESMTFKIRLYIKSGNDFKPVQIEKEWLSFSGM